MIGLRYLENRCSLKIKRNANKIRPCNGGSEPFIPDTFTDKTLLIRRKKRIKFRLVQQILFMFD